MKQKWWILLTLLLCGCGASSQPDQTGTVQNDRPRLSASTEETAENMVAVEKSNGVQGVQTRLKRKDRFESK